MTHIHPSAQVDPKARLEEGVRVGAYCVIGPHARVGCRTVLDSHVILDGHLDLGQDCHIHSHACLGTAAQARKLPVQAYLKVGDRNIIREFVTMNASMQEGGSTIVGDDNFIMTGAHIAHDCRVGSNVTIANCVALGGHVTLEDFAVIGGLSGIHQFTRVGRNAMIGGLSKVVMDVPPYTMCDGNPASLYGVNTVGLKRAGFRLEQTRRIRQAVIFLFGSGKNLSNAAQEAAVRYAGDPEVGTILRFIENSKRGILRISRKFHDPAGE